MSRPQRPDSRLVRVTHMLPAAALAITALATPACSAAQELLDPGDLVQIAATVEEATERLSYGDDPLQYGLLRLPEGDGPHPLVIAVHGGCYLSMFDIEHFAPFEQALTDEGYAVWSIEYRRVGDEGGGWPNSFLDVAKGIDFARTLVAREELALDSARIYAAGHSAGANYAIWAAARPLISPDSDVYLDNPLPIAGVLGLAPAATLGELHSSGVCGGVLDGLMGGSPEDVPDRYDAVSPMRLMPEGIPQRLVIGALDGWAPAGRAYYDAATAAGTSSVSKVEAPESGHFEMIAPGTSTWALVLQELEALTRR